METKNIIILVLSHYDEPYNKLERCIRETWADFKNDDVKLFFYHGGNKEAIFDDKIITTFPEGFCNIGYKTIRAFEIILRNYNFNYLLRTNSSSFINVNKYNDYLINKPKNNFYNGVIGVFDGIEFASGSGYTLSKDVVEKIVVNKNNWPHQYIDDVALSMLLKTINLFPSAAPRLDIDKLPITDIKLIDLNFHFRCKTAGDRNGDIQIMKELKKYV